MATIQIKNLNFTYPQALEPVFENVTLNIDTSWKLGLVGRNGRGKTTFLNLLRGKLAANSSIITNEKFEYFPVEISNKKSKSITIARAIIAPFDEWEMKMERCLQQATEHSLQEYAEIEERYSQAGGYTINEMIEAELTRLSVLPEVLERPYETLSGGEQIKLVLAALFLKQHCFLLIDEPTDHLDKKGRESVAKWIAGKSGFILVSHDRAFLDITVDHILAINRNTIEVLQGNYTTWHENKKSKDQFELDENEKLQKSIRRLEAARKQTAAWSDKVESSKSSKQSNAHKKGPAMLDRGYIGHQAAKMMQRSKAIDKRKGKEIEDKQYLLKDLDTVEPIFLPIAVFEKKTVLQLEDVTLEYGGKKVLNNISFAVQQGERIAIHGANGSGKSCLLRLMVGESQPTTGQIEKANGLVVNYVPQNIDFLQGDIQKYAAKQNLDISLFFALLRKLDFEREVFEQPMETYSAGQKKKVCIAANLAWPAHLFVWDEPLNYVDIASREQIEDALLRSKATVVFVEHDTMFTNRVATKNIYL